MANGKVYYWIKLRKEFYLDNDTVDFLMSKDNGAEYIVLYQMLCINCINTNGVMARTIGEVIIPFDVEKIQRDCKYFSQDTIIVALELFKKLGMIYEQEDGCLRISEFDNGIVGSETDYAIQKRVQRQNQKGIEDNSMDNEVDIVHTEIRDKRLEIRDKSIETREQSKDNNDKNKPINNNINIITAQCDKEQSHDAPKEEDEPTVITLPLIDKTDYQVKQSLVEQYKELYLAVDVDDELRKMKAWLISNPNNRKTRKGMTRFMNGWLSKEQDRARRTGNVSSGNKKNMGKWDDV